MIGAVLFGVTLLLIDQGSKRLAEVHASARPIACGRFLKIRSIANPQTTLRRIHPRIIFPVLWMIALLCAVLLSKWGGWFHNEAALWGLGLAFSGAAGNLVDLLRRESILDFIDLGWWPVFNVADAGIVAGLVLAFWPPSCKLRRRGRTEHTSFKLEVADGCQPWNGQFHTSSRILSIHRTLSQNIWSVGSYRKSDMSDSISQKRPRVQLASVPYSRLRKEILERDNWRCQVCGCLKNLDVHHMRRRSALGEDLETNLITVCRECHQILHGSTMMGNSYTN